MTRAPKTEALIKDIGRLFVTYTAADWEPILKELHDGSTFQRRMAAAIEEISAAQAAAKSRKLKKPLKTVAESVAKKLVHPERAPVLASLESALRSRELLRDTKALREAFSRTGAKDTPPAARSAAITALIGRLDQLPEERFGQIAEAIEQSRNVDGQNFDGDYARWFALILDRPTKPAALSKTHDNILTLMDRAMVRGASKYSTEDEAKLKIERERWLTGDGSEAGAQVVDRFLAIVRMARHAKLRDTERLDGEVYDLKQQWRELSPASSE